MESIRTSPFERGSTPCALGGPRIPLRAVRLGPNLQRQGFWGLIERFKAMGYNACALDAFEYSVPTDAVVDEALPGDWEASYFAALHTAKSQGCWTLAVLPIQLDVESTALPGRYLPVCRQSPEGRRRMIHRFESILERIPATDGIGFSITEIARCDCTFCRRTSFEEETAYYLRAFAAVMRRYAPTIEIWGLPDLRTWNLMQEVRGVVPTEVRFLAPDPTRWGERVEDDSKPGENSGGLDLGPEEGIRYDLRRWRGGEVVDFERVAALSAAWETGRAPRLITAEVDAECAPGAAVLTPFAWATFNSSEVSERLVFTSVLPEIHRAQWRSWRTLNRLVCAIRRRLREITVAELQAIASNLEGRLGPPHPADAQDRDGGLPKALLTQIQRWMFQKRIAVALTALNSPAFEGGRTHREARQLAVAVEDIHQALEEAGRNGVLEILEKRELETLADSLSLALSESPHSQRWDDSLLTIRTIDDLGWTDEF